jgi:hypothetical protein
MKLRQPISKLHLIQSVFLLAVPLQAYIAEVTCEPGSNDWSRQHWVALGYALYCVHFGFYFRRKFMTKAKAELAANPSDKKGLKRWDASQIVPLCGAYTVALTGLIIRCILHGALWQAALFYMSAVVLIFLWSPREFQKAAPAE